MAINQIILKRRWHIFQAAFMLTNPDNFYETLGHFPVVSVAQKASRFDKMPVKFPAVFVATKLNIHDEAPRHFLLSCGNKSIRIETRCLPNRVAFMPKPPQNTSAALSQHSFKMHY